MFDLLLNHPKSKETSWENKETDSMNNKMSCDTKNMKLSLFLFLFREVLKFQQIICEVVNHCLKVLFQFIIKFEYNARYHWLKERAL